MDAIEVHSNTLKRVSQDHDDSFVRKPKSLKPETNIESKFPDVLRYRKRLTKKTRDLLKRLSTKLENLKHYLTNDAYNLITKLLSSFTELVEAVNKLNDFIEVCTPGYSKCQVNSKKNIFKKLEEQKILLNPLSDEIKSFKAKIMHVKDKLEEEKYSDVEIKNQIQSFEKVFKSAKAKFGPLKKTQKNINHIKDNHVLKLITTRTNTGISPKRKTVSGDEYQRILQILLRQRGLNSPRSELGIEVCGVGQLDDIVFINKKENKCRFFQVKYSKTKMLTEEELFKEKTFSRQKSDLHLFFYFESFCKIKESECFEHYEIEEITFLTNMDIKSPTETSFLVSKSHDLSRDKCLSVRGRKAKKYSLDIDKVKNKYEERLKRESRFYLNKKIDKADQIVNEFLEKLCIVTNYPDLEELKQSTFKEVFEEDIFRIKQNDLLRNCINYVEIKLLSSNNEFVSNEEWKLNIIALKKFINGLKATGLSELKTKRLSSSFSCIWFENIVDVCDITQFLTGNSCSVLNCKVQNLELNAIKVLHILEKVKKDTDNFKEYNYYDLEDLFLADFVTNSFESGIFQILVVTCKYNFDNEKLPHLIEKLGNTLKDTNKKIIMITNIENEFVNSVKIMAGNRYSVGQYSLGFKDLSPTSKDQILNKHIIFQEQKITLGALLNHNENFANSVIDENCLWEIISKRGEDIILSNNDAFTSPAYDEQYYISRFFFQKLICYDALKQYLEEELFIISGACEAEEKFVENTLIKKGIDINYIKLWDGNRTYSNGIVILPIYQEFSVVKLPDEKINISKNFHWLFMAKNSNLFLIDSKENHISENRIVKTKKCLERGEETFLKSENHEKILILVGDSGVGKSTVLTSIANRIRKVDTNTWVLRVNLRIFFSKVIKESEGMVDLNYPQTAIRTLTKMASTSGSISSLEENLLEKGLEKSQKNNFKLILLLDGYNEVNKDCQDETCSLIKTLNGNYNVQQIWITTQIHDKVELECKLKVPAYFLNMLNVQDQEELMAKYWKKKYSNKGSPVNYEDNELLVKANIAIHKWKASICDEDEKSFTQIALNIIMLADVLPVDDSEFNESMNLLDLYDKFVQNKFSIYNKEAINPGSQHFMDIAKERLFQREIRSIFQEISVKIIVSKYQSKNQNDPKSKLSALERFKSCVGLENSPVSTLTKIGLVTERKGELDFSHYSFAQFFFSEYLILNLNNTFIQKFLVNEVLKENSLQLCRQFFNRLLMFSYEHQKQLKIRSVGIDKDNIGLDLDLSSITLLKTPLNSLQNHKIWNPSMKEKLYYILKFLLSKLTEIGYKECLTNIIEKEMTIYKIEKEHITYLANSVQNYEEEKVPNLLINIKEISDNKSLSIGEKKNRLIWLLDNIREN